MLGLDLSFFDLEMLRKFVLNGLVFSVQLTVVATLGGVVVGTLLALMRLSGQRWLMAPATVYVNGHSVVLSSHPVSDWQTHWCGDVGGDHLHRL
jgi:ABC-type amino acid transport system permease subunit